MKAQKEGRPLSHRPWIVGLWLGDEPEILGKETPLLRHWYTKCIILSRQARDKHRENSKKQRGVSSGVDYPSMCELILYLKKALIKSGRGDVFLTYFLRGRYTICHPNPPICPWPGRIWIYLR